jgi:hypothetical protein
MRPFPFHKSEKGQPGFCNAQTISQSATETMPDLPCVSVQSGGEFYRGISLCVSLRLLCVALCNVLRGRHVAVVVFPNRALDASLLL